VAHCSVGVDDLGDLRFGLRLLYDGPDRRGRATGVEILDDPPDCRAGRDFGR